MRPRPNLQERKRRRDEFIRTNDLSDEIRGTILFELNQRGVSVKDLKSNPDKPLYGDNGSPFDANGFDRLLRRINFDYGYEALGKLTPSTLSRVNTVNKLVTYLRDHN